VNFFHWTATFHPGSEVWTPYGEWHPVGDLHLRSEPWPWTPTGAWPAPLSRAAALAHYTGNVSSREFILAEKRVRGALWFVSNCGTESRRETAVERIKNHLFSKRVSPRPVFAHWNELRFHFVFRKSKNRKTPKILKNPEKKAKKWKIRKIRCS
jgi:hypothetical protein